MPADLLELLRFLRESGDGHDGLNLDTVSRGRLASRIEAAFAGGGAVGGGESGRATAGGRARDAGSGRARIAGDEVGIPSAGGTKAKPAAKRRAGLSPDARALLHSDGASRGNPGPAALGFVVYLEGEELLRRGEALGTLTNNQAEYRALLAGLAAVRELGFARVDVALDSELIVRQIEGRYKVKHAGLKPLHAEALRLLAGFSHWSVRHVPRAENAVADALANEALDSL